MKSLFLKLMRDESGASLIEYVLLAGVNDDDRDAERAPDLGTLAAAPLAGRTAVSITAGDRNA